MAIYCHDSCHWLVEHVNTLCHVVGADYHGQLNDTVPMGLSRFGPMAFDCFSISE
jgi:hypothetical protein